MFLASWFALYLQSCAVADDSQHLARQLLLTGKYAEAAEAYEKLLPALPIEAAIGQARSMVAAGKRAAATELLTTTQAVHAKEPRLAAELASLFFDRGNYAVAASQAELALKQDPDQPLARWVQAELYRTAGKLPEADAAYKWFVDQYNKQDRISDPDTLRLVGLAAAQYARWNRLADQYRFLIKDLYPEILKLDKNYWPAHYEVGLLYLEKFNQADAAKEFNEALTINPNAAEVHAALAALAIQNYDLSQAKRLIDRALEINAELTSAKQLQADVHLAQFDATAAAGTLREAQQLNPRDEYTLGRLAATYIARTRFNDNSLGNALRGVPKPPHGAATPPLPTSSGGRLLALIAEVNAQNPHAGEFYNAAGDALDKLRRYPAAQAFYQAAIDRLPQLVAPYGQLGLIQMRLADEAAAERTLKRAFDIDPFNVRVSNTLQVLDVLSAYATIETDHFIFKFDRGADEVLARSAATYLEDEVYPQITTRLGHRPTGKTLIEFFSRAKNTGGHGWFSARMIGLPYVGTVGACSGRVIALHSPNDARTPFNWARVLRHEFVHVVNLDQTDFTIPHWFTEALATHYEEFERPEEWNNVLIDAAEHGKLFDLHTINSGFVKPRSRSEWALAYCQAELYVDYLLSRYGDAAPNKLLALYAESLSSDQAISRAFGVDPENFQRGYEQHVQAVCQDIKADRQNDQQSTTRLKTLARDYLKTGDEKIADVLSKLAALEADNLLIRKKLATLAFDRHDWPVAERWATEAIHIDPDDAPMFLIAAESLASQGRFQKATHFFQLAVRLDNRNISARAGLVRSYIGQNAFDKARQELTKLKTIAPDDRVVPVLEESLPR
jgi:tetratricopeptide (TPR) repeat protein